MLDRDVFLFSKETAQQKYRSWISKLKSTYGNGEYSGADRYEITLSDGTVTATIYDSAGKVDGDETFTVAVLFNAQ